MRSAAAVHHRVSYAEYLRLEAAGDAKHEWLDGVVYAMAGGTLEHSALAASIIQGGVAGARASCSASGSCA